MKDDLKLIALAIALLAALPFLLAGEAVAARIRRKSEPVIKLFDEEAFLEAIPQRESGNNPLAIGTLGERTRFQFMRSTWQRWSKIPFEMAGFEQDEADRVARAHLHFLRRQAVSRGLPESPQIIAGGWKHGDAFMRHGSTTPYAREVAALYYDILNNRD